jgi:hypothetical protein
MRAEVPIVRTRRRMNLGERRDAGVKRSVESTGAWHKRLYIFFEVNPSGQAGTYDTSFAFWDLEKLLSRGVELAGYCLRSRALNR